MANSDLGKAIVSGVGKYLTVIQNEARKLVPVDTGELRGSIQTKVTIENGVIKGLVGTNVEYGVYVEFGTGPLGEASPKNLPPDFTPKYKKEKWVYPVMTDKGLQFYTTRGQPARPFLYPAFKRYEKDIGKYIAAELRKVWL